MRNGKFMKIPKANLSAVSNARYNSCHVHNSFLVFCTSIQLTFNRRDTLDLREASRSKYNLSPDEIHLPPKGDPTSQIQSINFWRHKPHSLCHAHSWHLVHLCGMRKRGSISLAPIMFTLHVHSQIVEKHLIEATDTQIYPYMLIY